MKKAGRLKIKIIEENVEKVIYGEKHLKILGIFIDQALSWDKNTSHIKQKATNTIRNVHRINKLLPMKQKRVLYNSLVTPHFTYGDILWNKCGRSNANKLQQAQNFSAKSMLGLSKYSSSTEALKKLELLPLQEKRNIHTAVHVKKTLEGKAPTELILKYRNKQRPTKLRPGNLQYPKHTTAHYENGPLYSSIKIWNSLPLHIRNTDLKNFKEDLQRHKLKQFLGS